MLLIELAWRTCSENLIRILRERLRRSRKNINWKIIAYLAFFFFCDQLVHIFVESQDIGAVCCLQRAIFEEAVLIRNVKDTCAVCFVLFTKIQRRHP